MEEFDPGCLWRFLGDDDLSSSSSDSIFLSVSSPDASRHATVAVSLKNSADDAVAACAKEFFFLPVIDRCVLKVAGRRSFIFGPEKLGRFEHVRRRTKVILFSLTCAVGLYSSNHQGIFSPPSDPLAALDDEAANLSFFPPETIAIVESNFFYEISLGPWEWGARTFDRVTFELVFRKQILQTFEFECEGQIEAKKIQISLPICPPGTRVLLKAYYGANSHVFGSVQFLLLDEQTGATPIGRRQIFLWEKKKDGAEEGCSLEPMCGFGKPSENTVSVWIDFGEKRFCFRGQRNDDAQFLSLSPGHLQNILNDPYYDLNSRQNRNLSIWNDRIHILSSHPKCLALVARCAPNFYSPGDLAQFEIDSEFVALDLLAPEIGNFAIRNSAVNYFGQLSDSRFVFFLPQLVALLRHESQPLICPLFQMLLNRAVKNSAKIGSIFFWLLFPDDPSAEFIFSQIREIYKSRISFSDRRLIVDQELFFKNMRNLQLVTCLLFFFLSLSLRLIFFCNRACKKCRKNPTND